MQKCIWGWIVVSVVAFATPFSMLAQQPGAVRGMPDLSGIWNRRAVTDASGIFADDANGAPFLGFTRQAPPLQPEAMEKYRANRRGVSNPRAKGRNDQDPLEFCFPPGPTRIFTEPRPFEIRQIPDVVYILSELNRTVRRIQTGGEQFDLKVVMEGYPPSWHGYSVGRYDGDTLVVETVMINEDLWLDSLGTPHSDALRLTERFRRPNRNTLEIEFRFDDPKSFTMPWGGTKQFQLQPPTTDIKEHLLCEEYRKPGIRTSGYEFFRE